MNLNTVSAEDVQTYARQTDFALKILAAILYEQGPITVTPEQMGEVTTAHLLEHLRWDDTPDGHPYRGIIVRCTP